MLRLVPRGIPKHLFRIQKPLFSFKPLAKPPFAFVYQFWKVPRWLPFQTRIFTRESILPGPLTYTLEFDLTPQGNLLTFRDRQWELFTLLHRYERDGSVSYEYQANNLVIRLPSTLLSTFTSIGLPLLERVEMSAITNLLMFLELHTPETNTENRILNVF
jgi:hypothetical protein